MVINELWSLNQIYFFVMGPKFYTVLRANVVRVAHAGDVGMQGFKVGLDRCQYTSD